MKNEERYYTRMAQSMPAKIQAFADYLKPGMRFLDLGSGPSADVFNYVTEQGAEYTAYDNHPQVVARLMEQGIPVYEGDSSGAYDIIYMSSVLHELGPIDRYEFGQLITKHLKPGGYLIIRDWFVSDGDREVVLYMNPDKRDVVRMWHDAMAKNEVAGRVLIEHNRISGKQKDVYNLVFHSGWGQASLERESREYYGLTTKQYHNFIDGIEGKLILRRVETERDGGYVTHLSPIFGPEIEHFIDQHGTKTIHIYQKGE